MFVLCGFHTSHNSRHYQHFTVRNHNIASDSSQCSQVYFLASLIMVYLVNHINFTLLRGSTVQTNTDLLKPQLQNCTDIS